MGQAIREVTGVPDPLNGIRLDGKTDPLILAEVYDRNNLARLDLAAESAAIVDRYLELLETGLTRAPGYRVLPGLPALLERLLDGGYALGLGTGNVEGGARLKLGRGHLNAFFPTGGFGSDGETRVEILEAGLQKARRHYQTDFDTVWVIGDTPEDILAATTIGARSLAVATGRYTSDALGGAGPSGEEPASPKRWEPGPSTDR